MNTAMNNLAKKLKELRDENRRESPKWSAFNTVLQQAKLQLQNENKQTIDFGNKMQIVRDIDLDGNIDFMFKPKDAYFQIFK